MSVHLHARSAYSLLSSTCRIEELVTQAKQYGFSALALTDKNVMHGAMAFYHACQKAEIKPLFGLECDVLVDDELFSLLLLAKNDAGYQNCLRLSTYLNTVSSKIELSDLISYAKECVVITSGDHCAFEKYLINEDRIALERIITTFKQSFADFYVSVAMNDSGLLNIKNLFLKEICINNGVPTTALSRIYYLNKEDEESYKILCAIKQGVTLKDKTLNVSSNRYFRTKDEMAALYDEDDLIQTEKIAAMCNVELKFEKAKLPNFINKFNVSSEEYLRQLCFKGLEKRFDQKSIPAEYIERLKYELDVIISMKFADYFLIVYDFIRFSRKAGIYVGPGRGSAPGSLVAYCLGITHIDPIRYHLLFERFLNPERVTMPDIDTDFPDNRRDEVIAYVREKYGNDCVANIVTFGTLAARQVLRDVGKVLSIQPREIDMLCKAIPNILNGRKVTLEMAYQSIERFRQMIHSKKEFEKLFVIARKLEGLPRHASTHAAGIVLSQQAITQYCPLIEIEENAYATQFTMEYLEELGLIKMDFLGLRNLTIIDEIVGKIRRNHPDFDIMKIPIDDERTFKCIQDVDTVGIFQLESEGMKNLIRQMQPKNFEDIAATIALFRPGPMENIPLYLKNRENAEDVEYLHEDLKPILKDTYGIIIYQEQIMQIATKMAGFSLAKADILRKAMSKKKLQDLLLLEKEFEQGALKRGYQIDTIKKVYDLILKFANYGFNRAHSVAYGLLAYQMAYLKANAPLAFFTSLLNSVIGGEMKTSEYIFEARKRGIEILPPDVSKSENTYVIEERSIRFPLLGIKNVGTAASQEILSERMKNGEFNDFYDFVARMSTRRISRKVIESLIMAGALDSFKMNRATMLASLDEAIRYAEIVKVEDENQVMIDFNLVSKPAPIIMREISEKRSREEKEMLGFYLSAHPIAQLRKQLEFKGGSLIENRYRNGQCELLGTIERVKQHKTKNGDLMAFAVLSDETGTFDLVCMPNIYRKYGNLLNKGATVIAKGKIDKENSCLVASLKEAGTLV